MVKLNAANTILWKAIFGGAKKTFSQSFIGGKANRPTNYVKTYSMRISLSCRQQKEDWKSFEQSYVGRINKDLGKTMAIEVMIGNLLHFKGFGAKPQAELSDDHS